MKRVRLTHAARCLVTGCDWTATGNGDAVDLEARRHTGERGVKGHGVKHPTVTEGVA